MTEYDVNYETDLRRKYLTPSALEKFDRWLNEIRAEAWDEGYQEANSDLWREGGREGNPYRPNEK